MQDKLVERWGQQWIDVGGAFILYEPMTKKEAFALLDSSIKTDVKYAFNIATTIRDQLQTT